MAKIGRIHAAMFGFMVGIGTAVAATTEEQRALAPSGKLRVALQSGNPLNAVKDPASGEMRGVGYELGNELARRAGVPFEAVTYPSIGALLEGGKAGGWDVAFVGYSPERAKEWDFSALHVQVEFGYVIAAGSAITSMAEVDRTGVRVSVQEKSGPDRFFTGMLRNAAIVRAPSNAAAFEAVRSGNAEAMGGVKPVLFELSKGWPGSRVLDDRPGIDPHAMAMPKGREIAAAYGRRFIETAKSEGLVRTAIDRAGLRGVVVAPLDGGAPAPK